MKLSILTTLIAISFMMNSCNNNSGKNDSTSPDEISVKELSELVSSGTDIYLIDVRTEAEFLAGRLNFADDQIPFDQMSANLDRLPGDKDTPIYLFCRSGRRSGIATKFLRSIGYSRATNITGGIIAWEDAGYQITDGPVAPDSSESE